MNPRISVCVPVWKRHGGRNIRSLAASMPAALDGLPGELVVTLNGVQRDYAHVPRDVQTVSFPVNRGVPRAWNAAAEAARGDILCFTNDDVVLGPGALRMMLEALDARSDSGVVGPAGTMWNLALPEHQYYVDLSRADAGAMEECDVVSGFLFATRRHDFERVGGFDTAYSPCGFEEVDYCTTVRARLGRRCYAVAGIPHEHEFGISARRPRTRVKWDGRAETLRSIRARNVAHFQEKWRDRLPGA